MSAVITSRGSNTQATYGSSVSVPAFTPGADTTLYAAFASIAGTSVTLSGHGTWTQVDQTTANAGTQLTVFRCPVGSSPSSAAVTASGTSLIGSLLVFELNSDYGAVVQSVAASSYETSGSSPYGVTLAAFGDATNNVTILVSSQMNSGASTWTPEGSLTQDLEENAAEHNTEVASFVGEDTTPASANPDTYAYFHNIGMEVEYTAVAGPDVTGTGTPSLPSFTGAGSGQASDSVSGDGAPSLPIVIASGSGTVTTPAADVFDVGGPVALTLPAAPTAAGSGAISQGITGSGSPVLPSMTGAGSGLASDNIAGTGTPSLPVLTMSGAGLSITTVTGTGALTLPALIGGESGPYPGWTDDEWFRRRRILRANRNRRRR